MTLDLGTSDAKGADLTSTTTDECYGTSRGSSLESKEAAEEFEPKKVWLIALATWLVQFCTYGYVSAFGVYQDYYTRDYLSASTPSDISWIGSVQLFLQYALGIVVGRIYDLGWFHHLIGVGTVLQTVSLFMLSLTRRQRYPEIFLAQAIGMGLGQAMLFLPSITVVSHHFRRRRVVATGVAVSGASVGGVIWPILLNQSSQALGFPNAIRITAALIGAFLLVANLLYFIACSRPTSISSSTSFQSSRPDFRAIFTDVAYLVSIAAAFCINLGLFFPFFYLQSYALSVGIKSSLAFYLLAILNGGSAFGRIIPNILAGKFGVYNTLLPSLYISSALVFAIFGIKNFAGLTIFAILYGFWSGAYVSLIPSLLCQLSPHPKELG
ncbi:hypothetical protein AGABI1DRAFT_131804 [Agaricus bisporus var. burnettii JB137-S8]|uniref:Major facilitator superfamily (MFS) profile domain-containing protein n=1 Tax=Agaricus bisporus var. burnettii (strain JB137-S8 / ATCC MYA-4627 / FGSC 10392) TaxID=597362 RepID=K5WKS0_AGABU|nr:uncharacterized protein AGABI1DRAFT_131804 [Agaricus bisporus var. burnettii JB137-S8]EKM75901.1 hypothetical protein AGABI1DRAFT_131804 [Agaricus bisporus var. burnettii JB137-S8]